MNLKHYMFSSGDYSQCLYYSNATYALLQSILGAAGSTFLSSFFSSHFVVFYFASLYKVLYQYDTEPLKSLDLIYVCLLLFVYCLLVDFNVLMDILEN